MQAMRGYLFKKRDFIFRNPMCLKKRKGFTLIELMIVLGLLMVIISLATWGMEGIQDFGRRVSTQQDMALLRDAVQVYQAMSKTGKPPTDLGQLVTGLTASQSIDGKVYTNFVNKPEWTSTASSFVDYWDNAYVYDATNRTITSTNNGGTSIVYKF